MNTHHTQTTTPEGRSQDRPKAAILLRLPPELAEQLRRLARAHDRSLNGELVWALRLYVTAAENEGSDGDGR